jgi:acetyl-CoA carboxylase biotin carboxyl carrier protein
MAKNPVATSKKTKSSAAGGLDIVSTVRGLAEVVNDHGLSELIVDLPDATVTLRRGGFGAPVMTTAQPMMASMPMMHHAPAPAAHAAAAAAPAAAPVAPVDDKSHVVTSPFVGTFYRKPNPDASFYVQLGDKITKGQVLCIVEAMKLMNEIESDAAGTLLAILVEDGSPVEYGQPLFKIAP